MRTVTILTISVVSLTMLCTAADLQVETWLADDKNGDGKLEREEVKGLMSQFFGRNDANQDGFLDQDELEALAERLNKRKGKSKRQAPQQVPDNVEVRKNLHYREGHERWVLDLYLPKGEVPPGGRPGMVIIHGGGWKSGSKNSGTWAELPAEYAAKGYACISVNYRLIPNGGGFPQCVHDVKNAVRWFRAHAEEFGLNPEKIGAYGNSAGAHLVSMLGLVQPDADLEGDGTYLDQSSLVQAVCASATPSDFTNWGKPNHGTEKFQLLTINKPEDMTAVAKQASPVTHASEIAPPFLLFHAKNDTVVPYIQGTALEKALKNVGTEVTLKSYEDGGHGVFGRKAKESKPAMEAFFEKHLKAN